MNATLTGLGLALVAALVAALIGPFFIDWSSYRSTFEQRAGLIAGVPVRVMGDVEARLLPSPRIRFAHVRAGAEKSPAHLEADEFVLDLALAPLLSGQYRITRLTMTGVDVRAALAEDGTLSLPVGSGAAKGELDRVSIDEISVRNARVAVADPAGSDLLLENVSLSGSASALSGPLKLNAAGLSGGAPFELRVSTGGFENGTGRVKIGLSGDKLPAVDLEGNLAMPSGRPVFEGKAAASAKEGAWRANGQIEADPRRITARSLDVSYGAEGQGLRLTGTGDLALGKTPAARAMLQARQFDLDRALGRGKEAPPLPPGEALQAFLQNMPGAPSLSIPFEGSVALDSVIIGGDVVSGARAQLVSAQQGWTVRALDMKLPGGAALGTSGTLVVNPWSPPSYSGRVTLDAPNMPALVQWLQGSNTRPDLGVRKLSLAADLATKPGAVSLGSLDLKLDAAAIRGSAEWQQAADGPDRISAKLTAGDLDLDALDAKRLAGWFSRSGTPPQFEVALKADHLTYARVPWRGVDVDASGSAAGADIRRLVVADLAGARIEAKGRVGKTGERADARLEGRIDAQSLEGVVAVLKTLPVPAGFTDALRTRTAALSPVALAGVLASEGPGLSVQLNGSAGKSRVALEARTADAAATRLASGKIAASSDDAAQMLRQIGLPVAGFEAEGPAKLDLALSGDGGKGLVVEGSFSGAGGRLHVRGRTDDEFLLRGHGELNLEDAGRLAVLLGRAPPLSLPVIPVSLNSNLMWRGSEFTADLITGFVAGRATSGRLSHAKGTLTGEVDLASVSLVELLGIAVGPSALVQTDAVGWPSGPIGAGLLDGVEGRIGIRAGALELGPGYVAGKAAMTLALSPTEFTVQDVSAVLAGGKLTGNLAVRKAGEEASVAARLSLENAGLGDLAWGPRSRPSATGTLNLTADALGSGKSLSALMAGLTGSGTFAVRNGRLNALDPGAFARTMATVETRDTPPDAAEVARRFETELAYGELPVQEVTSAFTIASGVLRVSNAAVTSPAASATASADLDLARGGINARLSVRPAGFEAVAGAAAPQAQLSFSGRLAAPSRSIDTTGFTSFLTVRALDREMKRVADMEAQRQERARIAAQEAEKRREAEADAARLRAIIESTGTVPMGELPPAVDVRPPPGASTPLPPPRPQAAPPPARRQVSPFDIFRRPSPEPAR